MNLSIFNTNSKSFKSCVRILRDLESNGIKAVVAGGWIRDKLNGIEPKDLDIFALNNANRFVVENIIDSHVGYESPSFYGNYMDNDMREDVVGVVKYKNSELDVIIMTQQNAVDVISNFDVSVCQLYGILNGNVIDVYATDDYLKFKNDGIIYQYTNIPTSESHLDRVMKKYSVDLTPKEMVLADVIISKIGVIDA